MIHDGYEYRYQAARGLERRKLYSQYWESVNGATLEGMTAEELQVCVNAMLAAREKGNE